MRCPKCKASSVQTGSISHKDELGMVQEVFCFCFNCNKDITERVTDEWIKSCTKQPNQRVKRQGKGLGEEGRGATRQGR